MTTTSLGIAFVAIGLAASLLQYWLWTFPMVPDPTGIDPNGVTTAPYAWRMVHRILGYLFAATYFWLAALMVPRLWRYDSDSWGLLPIVHAGLGLTVGLILVAKVLILRRHQKYGNRLRLVGTVLLLVSVAAVGLVSAPPIVLMNSGEDRQAREIVLRNCVQCHGLSRVVRESRDQEDWREILEEMREKAAERGLPDPTESQPDRLAAFLAAVPQEGESNGEEEGSRRRRRRGRDD
jgi:hypothetical protein